MTLDTPPCDNCEIQDDGERYLSFGADRGWVCETCRDHFEETGEWPNRSQSTLNTFGSDR